MAEQRDGEVHIVPALPHRPVLYVSVPAQQRVHAGSGFLPDLPHVAAVKNRRVAPGIDIHDPGEPGPDPRLHVPRYNAALSGFRIRIGAAELLQPGERFRLPAQLLQRIRRRFLRPAQRGGIEIPDVIIHHPAAQQLRLRPSLGRQAVHNIIGLRVPDQKNSHINTTFFNRW